MLPRATRAARVFLVTSGALVAGVALAGCGASAEDAAPEKRTFAISGRQLTVDTDNSAVELVQGADEGRQIKVTRWFDGWALGGTAGVSWAMDGDTLKLRLKCKGLSVGCEAKHRIEVPRGVAVTVEDGNGAVTARGFDADLKLVSDNGALSVRDAKGRLELRTSNGDVTADGIGSRQVSAKADNGGIRLAFAGVPDRVTTENGNGPTRIALPGTAYRVETGTGNGRTKVDVPTDRSGAHAVSAHSRNGDITVITASTTASTKASTTG
ncbi:DUF4097 family beta strand repeat-containing protein [Streptomyces sp. NPDC049577]|uniref:DUF4097 family beta strand repeat-containing protein n=1 Tax=Streptomyces sp. NPDC049577 TaxID=3155153 RepID=UPI00342DBA8F